MNMKKTIFALSLICLMVVSLAGCGSGGGESTTSAGNSIASGSDGGSTGGTTTAGGVTTKGVVKLTWDPPQAGVVEFKVYYGTSPGTYTSTFNAGITPSYTISGLPSGTYYFAVTASDSSGNESSYSNEVSKTIS